MFKPNMEAIAAWVASGQVSSDLDAGARQALKDQHPETLMQFKRCFSSADGKAVLDYLASVTVQRAPVDHRAENYLAYAQMRQGQNQIFAMILELMELGAELERNPDHGHEHGRVERGHVVAEWGGGSGGSTVGGGDDEGDDGFDPAGTIGLR